MRSPCSQGGRYIVQYTTRYTTQYIVQYTTWYTTQYIVQYTTWYTLGSMYIASPSVLTIQLLPVFLE